MVSPCDLDILVLKGLLNYSLLGIHYSFEKEFLWQGLTAEKMTSCAR